MPILIFLSLFINEIHYDNVGADINEFVEVFGTAGDYSDHQIILYNGDNGKRYNVTKEYKVGIITEIKDGYGVVVIPVSMQNGTTDGLALIDGSDNVIQFLSYEGMFTATNGPAQGMTSIDIGVKEVSTSTPVGYSLQLVGTGFESGHFEWIGPIPDSRGTFNTGQSVSSEAGSVVINKVTTDPQQDWSTTKFDGVVSNGTVSQGTDEWLELMVNKDGLNLTGWRIELNDKTPVDGWLEKGGAFQTSNYFGEGSFGNTKVNDYLILGNVKGSGQMSNKITIDLYDPLGNLIDTVSISGGKASGSNDETFIRQSDGSFEKGTAFFGLPEIEPIVEPIVEPEPIEPVIEPKPVVESESTIEPKPIIEPKLNSVTEYKRGLKPLLQTSVLFLNIHGEGYVYSVPQGIACDVSDCEKIESVIGMKCEQKYCSYAFDTASYVDIIPMPHKGYEFSSWGGHSDCVDNQLWMVGNRLCIAFFRKRP